MQDGQHMIQWWRRWFAASTRPLQASRMGYRSSLEIAGVGRVGMGGFYWISELQLFSMSGVPETVSPQTGSSTLSPAILSQHVSLEDPRETNILVAQPSVVVVIPPTRAHP